MTPGGNESMPEFRAMIEEEAGLLDRFGMDSWAAKLRACTTMREAIKVHEDVQAIIRVAGMVSHD